MRLRSRDIGIRNGALALVAIAAALFAESGCAVSYPPDWQQRVGTGAIIRPTPWKMYGVAPLSWDLPGEGRILITARRAAVISGMGLYRADLDFTATHTGSGEAIRCKTEPSGPDVPRTRFGCWSTRAARPLSFWLAPDAHCPARDVPHAQTLTTPQCWDGQLTVGEQRAELRHGFLKSTGAPVGYVSWLSEQGAGLLAAEIGGGAIRIFEARRGQQLQRDLRRALVMLTVALHFWEEASLRAL